MPSIVQDPRTALLLGVVFSKELNPKRGQGFRDRVRCEALENEGFIVKTLDNKHDEELARDGNSVLYYRLLYYTIVCYTIECVILLTVLCYALSYTIDSVTL